MLHKNTVMLFHQPFHCMSPRPPRPSTVVVHRQRRCWCPPRTPMSPRPSRPLPCSFTGSAAADARRGHRCRPGRPGPLPWSFTGSAAAGARRGPAITLPMSPRPPRPPTVVVHRQRRCWCPPRTPMSPRPSRPLPWSFTGSAAADAHRGRRCRPGCPGLSEAVRRQHRCCRQRTRRHNSHRGRSPTAPPLTRCCPADANQAVPTATDVVHRQHCCCCLPRSHRCPSR